jgi:predicted alpha/beta superfamily hydrolase
MGSSLGGLVSFYLAWQWPDVFGKVACLWNTFSFRDNLLDRVSTEPKRDIKIYLDSGWPRDNYEPTRAMRDRLSGKGIIPVQSCFTSLFQRQNITKTHGRSAAPFQFLFGKLPMFGECTESARIE